MDIYLALTLLGVTFIISMLGTRVVLSILKKRLVLDIPNERSNHTIPTPCGAGIAVIFSLVIGWTVFGILKQELALPYMPFFLLAMGLTLFSFLDDIKPLPIALRFLIQIIAVVTSLYLFMGEGAVFQGLLPLWVDKILTAFIWLWFINLYNFMDGIDGITAIETICIAFGVLVIATLMDSYSLGYSYVSIAIIAAALGFLVWNWHPAKIFLGDSGSISLGYLLGWLLIFLAMAGYWQAALIIPGYYLFDSTCTLLHRIIKKEKFWQAHSQHFYQKAVRRGLSPRIVNYVLLGTNSVLFVLALLSLHYFWWPLVAALATIISMVFMLMRLKPSH